MNLRPEPHPIRDFFLDGLVDYSPKDSSETMERPFCSLTKAKRIKPIDYTSPDGKVFVRVLPHPEYGMATIWDFDILIFCISRIVQLRNASPNSVDCTVHTSSYELLRGIARRTSGGDYADLEAAINRLRHTSVETNIRARLRKYESFNLITQVSGTGKAQPGAPLSQLKITLPDWLLEGIERGNILTLDREYFRLKSATEKALYRIARKHAGSQPHGWTCRMSVLHSKVGSEAKLKGFAFAVRKIVERDKLPRYTMTMTTTASGEAAVHFVDRALLDAKTASKRLAAAIKRERPYARTAWLDAGLDPREFDDAYDAWCEAGHAPADFPDSITRPRLL